MVGPGVLKGKKVTPVAELMQCMRPRMRPSDLPLVSFTCVVHEEEKGTWRRVPKREGRVGDADERSGKAAVFEIKTGIGRPIFGAAKKKRAEISDVEKKGEKTEKQKKNMLSSRPRSA